MAQGDYLIESISPKAFKQVQQFDAELTKVVETMGVLISDSKKIKLPSQLKGFSKEAEKSISDLNKKVQDSIALNKKLQAEIEKLKKVKKDDTTTTDKLTRANKRLAEAQTKEGKELEKVRQKTVAVNKENRLAAKIELQLAGAYAKLNQELAEAELKYRNLAVSQGKSSKATQKAEKEVLKLRKQLEAVNKPVSTWNKGQKKYLSGLRDLAGALGWAGLTFAIVNGLKAAYETIKTYDALNKALQKVTGSQLAAALEFSYVIDLSERYGTSLEVTTKSYTSFLAAVKNTNLEGSKSRKIFESVTKATAAMGLSADDTKGAMLALTQMVSKGKVSAEELRGQLGERIPGAFQIMARAIGVTTAELDNMLKKGEVIAEDVLPKFAKELEKAFGVENTDRINTLAAAQNRLSTAWTRFILSVENGEGILSRFIKGSLEVFTSRIDSVRKQLLQMKITFGGFNALLEQAESFSFVEQSEAVKDEKSLESINSSLQRLNASYKERYALFSSNKESGVSNDEQKNLRTELAIQRGVIKAYEEKAKLLSAEKNRLIDKIKLADDSLSQADLEKQSIKDLYTLYEKYENSVVSVNKAKKGSADWYSVEISKLEKIREATATTSKEYAQQTIVIEALRKQLNKLTGNKKDGNKQDNSAELRSIFELQKFKIEQEIKTNESILKSTKKTVDEQIIAYDKIEVSELKLLELERDFKLLHAKNTEEKTLIELQYSAKKFDYALKTQLKIDKIIDGSLTKQKKVTDDKLSVLETEKNKEILIVDKAFKDGEITKEQHEKNLLDIQKRYAIKRIDLKITELKALLDTGTLSSEDAEKAQEKIIALQVARNKAANESFIQGLSEKEIAIKRYIASFSDGFIESTGFETTFKLLNDQIEGFGENWEVTFNAIAESAQETFNFLSELGQIRLNNQLNDLQIGREQELQYAEGNEQAQNEIRERYRGKEKELREKAAERQKQLAVFNSIVNTAQAAIAAYSSQLVPTDVTSIIRAKIAAATTTAFGLAQTALILSTNVPQFKDGHFAGTHKGYALVNDGGQDEVLLRDNKASVIKGRNVLLDMELGDKILPSTDYLKKAVGSDLMSHKAYLPAIHAQSERNLSKANLNIAYNGLTQSQIETAMTSAMNKTLAKQPKHVMKWDGKGYSAYTQKGISKTNYLNDRLSL